MKKIILLSGLIIGKNIYGDDEFYEDKNDSIQLEETIISTKASKIPSKNSNNTITSITAKDIEKNNYQSISDALKDIPNINLIGDPKNPIIDMRGQGNKATSNVQVLIDGIPINLLLSTSHSRSLINTIPIENVENIEIIPGGGTILYGSGTVGGVINISTKGGSFNNGGTFGTEFDSFGSKKGEFSYGTTFKNLGINLNYIKNDYKGFRDGDKAKSDYFQGGLNYKNSKNNISLTYSNFNEDSTSPRDLLIDNLSDRKSNGLRTPLDELLVYNTKKQEVNGKYEYKFNNNLQLDLISFYQETKIFENDNYGENGKKILSSLEYKDKKIGFKPKLKYRYREKDNLIIGYDYIDNTLSRVSDKEKKKIERYTTDLKKISNSFFALNQNKFKNFELIEGIRYEHSKFKVGRDYLEYKGGKYNLKDNIDSTRNMENFAYEIIGKYLYSETGNIYIKEEKGFTSPTPDQLLDRYNGIYKPNNLKSEKYLTYEIGFKDYIYNSFINGAIFLTDTTDEIANEKINSNSYRKYNIGKTRRIGAEIGAEQKIGKLTIKENYAFINTKIIEHQDKSLEGNKIPNVPENKFNLAFDYQITPKANIMLDTYYSEKYYLNEKNTGGKKNKKFITNIKGNYQATENLKIFAGIDNIFNDKYYNSISSDGTEYDPAGDRRAYAGIKYKF